jgi:hypothetical protein
MRSPSIGTLLVLILSSSAKFFNANSSIHVLVTFKDNLLVVNQEWSKGKLELIATEGLKYKYCCTSSLKRNQVDIKLSNFLVNLSIISANSRAGFHTLFNPFIKYSMNNDLTSSSLNAARKS